MLSGSVHSLTIRVATAADASALASFASQCFDDTFARDNDPRDMTAYMDTAFGENVQRAEITEPHQLVLLAEREGALVGYAMLRDGPGPDVVGDRDSIELARLYVMKDAIGGGVGAALMQRCLDEAMSRGRRTMWLGVWEHNQRALAFYRRWQFTDVGSHVFVLGRDRQIDRLMSRLVEPSY